MAEKTLIVLVGPTAVGKTELSISIAEMLNSPIISADSRQMYKEMKIGTAAPTAEQLERVKHYFIGNLELTDYYSASEYEKECVSLLEELFKTHDTLLLIGGSMMYIDAVCKGIDDMPTISDEVRNRMKQRLQDEGLERLSEELKVVDKAYYDKIDHHDTKRTLHALEVYYMTGRSYSSFHTNEAKKRDFRIVKIGLRREREELFERIGLRVDQMIKDGFVDEARQLYSFKHLNSLNTVGYKELFNHFDGEWTLEQAIEKIKRNTRIYSKKQMTWFKRDETITWFDAKEKKEILSYINNHI
ncbi:MAG: tRNA (adenosine(37)-N6)-dimethylallyltransferase MiaA [Bacteroidaceae bacterium]|nr:tRNA (adenosine(37)-N6)-dimethylallyltransferase MiaA [Bacteroidaceae bacterium]